MVEKIDIQSDETGAEAPKEEQTPKGATLKKMGKMMNAQSGFLKSLIRLKLWRKLMVN